MFSLQLLDFKCVTEKMCLISNLCYGSLFLGKSFLCLTDLIANANENALLTDSYGESPADVPATPPPTAVNDTGNFCLFNLFFLFFHYVICHQVIF